MRNKISTQSNTTMPNDDVIVNSVSDFVQYKSCKFFKLHKFLIKDKFSGY